MNRPEEKSAQNEIPKENSGLASAANPAPAYIPACGTLCDAFWWARRSTPAKPSE